MPLLETFRAQLASLELPRGRAIVAVSGGPDSVALLDLLVQTRDSHQLDLIVGHVDHGIHAESARVADQVRALAESYGLPFAVGQLGLGPEAGETSARAARYAWLQELRVRSEAELILTAHHADDQVETVLMRVLAGSGPAGLAAMASVSGTLVRPLLSVPRSELTRYVEQRGLSSWLDPANADPRHLRAWIRTELLPLLRRRIPSVDSNLTRVAYQSARDRAALDAVLDALPGLDLTAEPEGISVAAAGLVGYDSPLTQAIVLAAARRVGCRLGPVRIGRVLDLLREGNSGSRAPLAGGWWAELAFGRLRIWRNRLQADQEAWTIEGERGEGSWGRWLFRWEPSPAPEEQPRAAMSAWFTDDALTVRSWAPGEKLRPLGGTGRRLIVRCFQEGRVPRGRRAAWPVLARNQEIIWIPGVCRSDAMLPTQGMEALRIDAEYA
jgi:tRNA(Ile)-lysidine synthetase-like protein